MTILVIALGGILSLCGALAIGAGYPIVQVERGWTEVIAGSVALSCGIVTIALGLILHRLTGLHALVRNGKGVLPIPRERPVRSGFIFARNVKSRGPVIPATARSWETDHGSTLAPAPSPQPASGAEAEAAPHPPHPEQGFDNRREPAAVAPGAAEQFEEDAGGEDWLSRNHGTAEEPKLEQQFDETSAAGAYSESRSQPLEPPGELAGIEAMLRKELNLAQDLPGATRTGGLEPSPEAFQTGVRPSFGEAEAGSQPWAPLPEPVFPELPPAVCGDQLAIVGRYESEGASYVMYSDGSIEARTERAVFHFKSMAELKSFLESQAENS